MLGHRCCLLVFLLHWNKSVAEKVFQVDFHFLWQEAVREERYFSYSQHVLFYCNNLKNRFNSEEYRQEIDRFSFLFD